MSTPGSPPYGSADDQAGRAAMFCAAGGCSLTLLAFFAMPLINFGQSVGSGRGLVVAPLIVAAALVYIALFVVLGQAGGGGASVAALGIGMLGCVPAGELVGSRRARVSTRRDGRALGRWLPWSRVRAVSRTFTTASVLLALVVTGCGASTGTGSDPAGASPPPASPGPTSGPTSTGATGSTSSSPAPSVGALAPAPATGVLYSADWSSGLDGWSGSEDWTALRGELLCAGKLFSLEAGAVAPIAVDTTGDFAVEAEIRVLRYQITNGSFGVMVRVQEDGSGYAVGHHAADDLVLLRGQPGGRPTLDRQPFTPGEGWHRYRVEVRGNQLQAFIDGAPVLGATDNTFLDGKRVGLWSSGAQLSVRSFTVTML